MLSFTSHRTQVNEHVYGRVKHHPDVEENGMLLDDLDDEVGTDRLTARLASPGMPLTSSQAFMQ